MRQIFEDGLRIVIQSNRKAHVPFKLRDGSFGGSGTAVAPGWATVRAAIYEGRGE